MLCLGTAVSQPEMQIIGGEGTPLFFCDVLSYKSNKPDRTTIDLYVHVPYKDLRFIKYEEKYLAKYETIFTLKNEANEQILDQSWQSEIDVPDFGQTQSQRHYHLTQKSFDVPSGSYKYKITMRDIETGKSLDLERPLKIPNFNNVPMSISSIMVVSRVVQEGGRRIIVPNVSANVVNVLEGFYFFFKVYSIKKCDSLALLIRITDTKNEQVYSARHVELTNDSVSTIVVKIVEPKLTMGGYLASVEASSANPADKELGSVLALRTFSVRFSDFPITVKDIDKAIEQLTYLAKDSELDSMRAGSTGDEKRRRFREFWSKRDPDPSTERNELMEEYYRRVAYTNQAFGTYIEGWRTDRGMVYIRFGPPENVERHPFEYNTKPYEIWYYYQQNRQFVFVDESGFGDYRLRYPTTDLWGRIR
jgi:GWxTD domain-containing protein